MAPSLDGVSALLDKVLSLTISLAFRHGAQPD